MLLWIEFLKMGYVKALEIDGCHLNREDVIVICVYNIWLYPNLRNDRHVYGHSVLGNMNYYINTGIFYTVKAGKFD